MNQMMQMFGQMMSMPMNVFAETFARTMQGMQAGPMSGGCQPAAALCAPAASSCGAGSCTIEVPRAGDCSVECCGEPAHQHGGWQQAGDACCSHGGRHSSGDRLVLYEYTLVDVGRTRGSVLAKGQMLVDSCTSSEEVHNMVIVQYLECHRHHGHGHECHHDGEHEECHHHEGHHHEGHHHVSGKNLRVFCRQLDSWCKAPWDYEARQVATLEEIREAILHKR